MKFIAAHTTNFTTGRTRKIDHIVIHYTGNDGDTAEGNGKYFSASGREASAHYFVDERETVQSVKESDTAWHAGNWTMNCRSIGVEMCSRKDANGVFYIPAATVANAQKLVRELMAKYGIPASNVIRHYDVTQKMCPEPFVRDIAQWTRFKEGLTVSANETELAKKWAIEKGIFRGDEKGNMNWKDPITREQIAIVMYRMFGKS